MARRYSSLAKVSTLTWCWTLQTSLPTIAATCTMRTILREIEKYSVTPTVTTKSSTSRTIASTIQLNRLSAVPQLRSKCAVRNYHRENVGHTNQTAALVTCKSNTSVMWWLMTLRAFSSNHTTIDNMAQSLSSPKKTVGATLRLSNIPGITTKFKPCTSIPTYGMRVLLLTWLDLSWFQRATSLIFMSTIRRVERRKRCEEATQMQTSAWSAKIWVRG